MVDFKKLSKKMKIDRFLKLTRKIDSMWELKDMVAGLTGELDTYKKEIKEEMQALGYVASKTKKDGTKIPGDKLETPLCTAQLIGGTRGGKLNIVKLVEAGVSTNIIEKCTDPGKPTLSLRLDRIKGNGA